MGVLVSDRPVESGSRPRPGLVAPVIVLALGITWTAFYASMSFDVSSPAEYRFFPPFREGVNRNMNRHLGAEYYSIAESLYAGDGFANPFRQPTGPTAWMPPVLPAVLAALLWANDGDRDAVMNAVVSAQVAALIATGVLVLAVARRTAGAVSPWAVLAVYGAALASQFFLAFQITHDGWLALLGLTLLLAGTCFGRPLGSRAAAAGWGLCGGVLALTGPVLGLVWGVLTLADAVRLRAVGRLVIAVACALLAVSPWAVRNYRTFGRVIPVKSNLGYELYQSQCLEPDGVLRLKTFLTHHPYNLGTGASAEYARLGESAYVDGKAAAFRAAVRADPWGFVERVGNRFLAATLVYVPMDEEREDELYWGLWVSRVTHALPFLSAVLLLGAARWSGLRREQGVVLLTYAAYLLPYVLVSYYDRYGFPLVGVKVLLVVWAGERLARTAGWWGATDDRPPAPVSPGPPPGPMLHRWAAGLLVCGGVWWWYGGDLLSRLDGPKFDGGGTVVVPDFFQEWYSARLWWEGRPPYGSLRTGDHHLHLPPGVTAHYFEWNAHPPGAVFLALPLGGLEFADALPVWNLISVWALAGSVLLVVTGLGLRVPGWAVLPAATAVAFTNPFWTQVTHGQLNLILLALVVGAWSAGRAGRAWLAGGLVAAAAVVKLFPAYLLVYFALTGRWRAVAAGCLGIAAGVALTSAVLGWDVWPTYVTEVVPHTKEFSTIWVNASLAGWWLKLFDPAMPWIVHHPWPIVRSREVATAGWLVSAAALTALLWRCTRGRPPAVTWDTGYAAAVVVALLVSPTTWDHYFLLLLLPAAVLWRDLPAGRRWIFWVALTLLAVSAYVWAEAGMLLVGEVGHPSVGGWESPPWLTATVLSVHTGALLGLLALLVTLREPCHRAKPPGAASGEPA